jgi:DNA-binding GntR family transcriptional regulator
MMRHHVSRSVAKWAVAVLKADGLVEGRQGAGVFVRDARRLVREPHRQPPPPMLVREPYLPAFDPDPDEPARIDPWSYRAEEITADRLIAQRLAVVPGEPVLQTSSRYLAAGTPLQLVMSWQPSGLPGGMPVESLTGRRADQLCERVIVRAASPDEIDALALPARGSVLAIARTYTARGVPVETADIVIPSDRCELVYRLPVG